MFSDLSRGVQLWRRWWSSVGRPRRTDAAANSEAVPFFLLSLLHSCGGGAGGGGGAIDRAGVQGVQGGAHSSLSNLSSEQPLHTGGGCSYFCLIFKSACFIFSSILLQLNIIHFQLRFTYFWSSSQPLIFKPSSSTQSYSLQTSDLQHLHTLAKGDRPMQAHDLYFFANCEKISYIFLCATRSLIFANCGAKYHIW